LRTSVEDDCGRLASTVHRVCLSHVRRRLQDANKAVLEERERSQRNDQQLSDYEAEIGLLRRRLETLETDRDKDKKTIAHLQEALNRARVVCITRLTR